MPAKRMNAEARKIAIVVIDGGSSVGVSDHACALDWNLTLFSTFFCVALESVSICRFSQCMTASWESVPALEHPAFIKSLFAESTTNHIRSH